MDQAHSANGDGGAPASHAGRDPRRTVGLDARLTRPDGESLPVTIRDLSYNGCGVRSSQSLFWGETLKLEVPGRGAIMVTVRWCDGPNAGLEFAGDAPVAENPQDQVERISPRRVAHTEVMVRKPGGPMWSAEVADVSPEGCRIAWVAKPREGDTIWIKFNNLEALDARICWVEGRMAGLEFIRPIHPAVFELLIARLGA